jgi:hypothetical protein
MPYQQEKFKVFYAIYAQLRARIASSQRAIAVQAQLFLSNRNSALDDETSN